MKQPIEESTVRDYLLGRLGEESARRREVEERLINDTDFQTELDAAEDDLIDDYLRGALSADDRKDFERYFLITGERRDKLGFAATFHRRLPPLPRPEPPPERRRLFVKLPSWLRGPRMPSYAVAAAMALLVLALGLVAWRVLFRRSDLGEGLTALRTAYSRQRPVEPRVTGLDYAPLLETRGEEGEQGGDAALRRRAEIKLLDALEQEPGPATRHALGRLYLYERRLEEAVSQLEAAVEASPDDASIQNDLGAALLESGKEAQGRRDEAKAAQDFARGLEHVNRALALDGSLSDALFNRAILLEQMYLYPEAEEAWRVYLEKDSTSPWAVEARGRLARLEGRRQRGAHEQERRFEEFADAFHARDGARAWGPLGRSRARAGNRIVERLLKSYHAEAAGVGAGEASHALEMLSFAGEVEERQTGDRFTADLARFYRGAGATQLRLVAHARALSAEAQKRFDLSELDEALALFEEARREFERGGDACEALLAEQSKGLCYLRIPEVSKGKATFERLKEEARSRGYAALQAQALHALGDASTSADEQTRAVEYADQAMELSDGIKYAENVVRCLQSYTSMHRREESFEESLAQSRRGLSLAWENTPEPRLIWPLYAEAGSNYADLGLLDAALSFQREALRLALESKWPYTIERSYGRLSQVYLKLGDHGAAVEAASLAVRHARGIGSERSRNNAVANALLRLGHVYRGTRDPARAIESYDESLRLYEGLGLKVYDLEAHRGKLLAYSALGDDDAAERTLGTLLARLEEYRRTILEVQHRDRFFHASQDVYDAATDFAYTRRGDARAAFEFAEKSHGRSLLDLMRSDVEAVDRLGARDVRPALTTEPLTLEEIQRRMPERTQILQYHVLGDKVLAWLISPGEFEARPLNIKAVPLSTKVKDYVRLVREGHDAGQETAAARELYEILVAPLEPRLNAGRQLCVVADKVLNRLPFAALVSNASGRRLFEERALVHSPGASVFVVASESARVKGQAAGEGVLSVGDPAFDREKFRGLPPLPAAEREAREVAALYEAQPLLGAEAGEAEVTSAMRGAGLIQLATHYVIDKGSPLRSSLLLAGDARRGGASPSTDGELQTFEVYRMKLPRARLVVLSACQTGVERVYGGEGAVGVARPFIAAGAPLVVASLWPVESEPTAELMIALHRHRTRGGLATAEALRHAQLDMLASPDPRHRHPKHWAAFTLIGGYAEF